MNTDIRISVQFLENPKVMKLERRLGFQSIRSLIALWTWTAKNRPTGDLSGLDCEDIEEAAQWGGKHGGENGKLMELLFSLKFLDQTNNGGYVLHHWLEHNPWAAESEERSDQSRLNRMAKTYPAIYQRLIAEGKTGISSSEYVELTQNEKKRSTPLNDPLTTRSSSLTPVTTPVPAPQGEAEAEPSNNPTEPLNVPQQSLKDGFEENSIGVIKSLTLPDDLLNGRSMKNNDGSTTLEPFLNGGSQKNKECLTLLNDPLTTALSPAPSPSPVTKPKEKTKNKDTPQTTAKETAAFRGGDGNETIFNPANPEIQRTKQEQCYSPEFEAFWAEYPRKIYKKSAYIAWKTAARTTEDKNNAVVAAKNYALYVAQRGDTVDHIRHGESFLQRDRWRDFIAGMPKEVTPQKSNIIGIITQEEMRQIRAKYTDGGGLCDETSVADEYLELKRARNIA
ncbi:hypothetical protein FACS1894187_05600 [Synergistales bacterium]|nr:hypothetical protein FACS1894187_05600 [Synergistales bacterium]